MFMDVLPAYMSMYHMYAAASEARRGYQIPQDESYNQCGYWE